MCVWNILTNSIVLVSRTQSGCLAGAEARAPCQSNLQHYGKPF